MKRAFIIHGWDGHPNEAWFPWLANELRIRGFEVVVPQMPRPEYPEINTWVAELARLVGTPDRDTYLVGHSIGVQTILRYLGTIDAPIGGVLCVAGWLTLIPGSIGTPEDEQMAKPWLELPIDDTKVRHNAGKIAAIFSDNDRYVPITDAGLFAARFGASTATLSDRGHLGVNDHAQQVPEILTAFESLLQ